MFTSGWRPMNDGGLLKMFLLDVVDDELLDDGLDNLEKDDVMNCGSCKNPNLTPLIISEQSLA